jgi:hypothetical protein
MDLFPGRSFRFCFTNEQMAQAVVDFVWSQPDLRPYGNPLPAIAAALAPDPLAAVGLLAAHAKTFPPSAAALEWDDDPYSVDLSRQFKLALHESQWPAVFVRLNRIPFSVGGFDRPNVWEAEAAGRLVREQWSPWERQLLVLPAAPAAARRVLRALTGAAPLAGRNLVAIGGDSMNINTVYRDGDIAWNVRAVPVPFVFFTHQNPVAWDEVPESVVRESVQRKPSGNSRSTLHSPPSTELLPPNGTDDVLLHADLVRRLAEAAFPQSGLLSSADALAERLRDRQPAYFDTSGDRQGGRGEYVVCLRPQILDADGPAAQVLAAATLDVWTRSAVSGAVGVSGAATEPLNAPATRVARWQLVKRLVIDYDGATRPSP